MQHEKIITRIDKCLDWHLSFWRRHIFMYKPLCKTWPILAANKKSKQRFQLPLYFLIRNFFCINTKRNSD